ncbi:MAG: hypothetical protein ACOC35_12575, partial [Promethearchaeia archaeon]
MVSVRKKLFIPLLLGILFISEALIFRFFIISPYREFIGTSEQIVSFNSSLFILIFLKAFFWLGVMFVVLALFLWLVFTFNPERDIQLASSKNQAYPLFLLTFIIIALFFVIYPPFWLLGIISLGILVAFIVQAKKGNKIRNLT